MSGSSIEDRKFCMRFYFVKATHQEAPLAPATVGWQTSSLRPPLQQVGHYRPLAPSTAATLLRNVHLTSVRCPNDSAGGASSLGGIRTSGANLRQANTPLMPPTVTSK